MQSGDRERAIRAGWSVNVSEAFAADEANYEAFREAALTRPVAVEVIMRQMQAIAGHDTSARLATITAPTLVIHGTDDQMLPSPTARRSPRDPRRPARAPRGRRAHVLVGAARALGRARARARPRAAPPRRQ